MIHFEDARPAEGSKDVKMASPTDFTTPLSVRKLPAFRPPTITRPTAHLSANATNVLLEAIGRYNVYSTPNQWGIVLDAVQDASSEFHRFDQVTLKAKADAITKHLPLWKDEVACHLASQKNDTDGTMKEKYSALLERISLDKLTGELQRSRPVLEDLEMQGRLNPNKNALAGQPAHTPNSEFDSGNDADEECDGKFKNPSIKPTKRPRICVDSKENTRRPAKRRRQGSLSNCGSTPIVFTPPHHTGHLRTAAMSGNIVERIKAQHQRAQRTLIEQCAADRTFEQGVADSLKDTVKAMRKMNRRCIERETWTRRAL
ncbi:hypothetical protein CYLTODRAFT_472711 [Cylindrobasidium torrendii FP15055 ss-10]|uniref:Uncharacterized protein n=1 Tax=Cylindrobasidium torrendii FP15055 ss-10 TaxID=1314674 RepID=A0A0D7BTI9_9AGAR|nr:hypothetical protein CYLTODRAFT_472711 [Cylindrobasidium torrendii FP15055 ss-10]